LLRAIEDRLCDPQFQRVHRNAIVNVNHVRKLTALSSQRWCLTLSNSLQLVVAKRQGARSGSSCGGDRMHLNVTVRWC
jgi:DNA-binding LytR/AlgR family response regulator